MRALEVDAVGWFSALMIAGATGILFYGLAHRYLNCRSRLVYFCVGFVLLISALAVWFYEHSLEQNRSGVLAILLWVALFVGGLAGVLISNHTLGDR